MRLALFDLDHTLLSADSDVLWCEFMIVEGRLAPMLAEYYQDMALRYEAGTVTPTDYCTFHARALAGLTPAELRPLRQRFFESCVRPRIPDDSRVLLRRRRELGETLVLTTATSRVVSELTAADLGVDHYLCTELERDTAGCYTGRTAGVPNMRSGKIDRLRQWLREAGHPEELLRDASFYSDSINDLALLSAVKRPIVVDPDPRLESTAHRKGWSVLRLNRPVSALASEVERSPVSTLVPEPPHASERRGRERQGRSA